MTTHTIAGITNVGLCMKALNRAIKRTNNLPGITAFYGPSGYGKTFAASFAANQFRAYYVACKSTWTRKFFLESIIKEMGLQPGKTIPELADQISEHLAITQRPLIIDEVDYLVQKKAVDLIKDLYEGSQSAILIIGEEQLPQKLRRPEWERTHGRVLDWVQAQPVSVVDVSELANIYGRDVNIHTDLLTKIHQMANGSVRRVCVNIDRVVEYCKTQGKGSIDLKSWGNRELYTGEAPIRTTALSMVK